MDFNKSLETTYIKSTDIANAMTQAGWAFVGTNGYTYTFLARSKNGELQVAAILNAAEHKYQANQNIEWEDTIMHQFPRVTADNILYIYLGDSRAKYIRGRHVLRVCSTSGSLWGYAGSKFNDVRGTIKKALTCERKADSVTAYSLYGHTYSSTVSYLLIAMIATAMFVGFNVLTDPYTWGVGTGYKDAYRFVTYLFIHSNLMHLMSNLIAFVAISLCYADLQGGLAVTVGFFGGGILAALSSISYNELMQTPVLTVGASGAIFALLGAVIIVKVIDHTATRGNLYIALIALAAGALTTGVDMACHIGGFLGGMLIGWAWYEVSENYYMGKALKTKASLTDYAYQKNYSPQGSLQGINCHNLSRY